MIFKDRVLTWNQDIAYAIGLITSDGNLSPDHRHINFTSKDYELACYFKRSLELTNKIGRKGRGGSTQKNYYVVQFGNVGFYHFLLGLGLTPKKSKTIEEVWVPEKYFFDFLRGLIDGDGNICVSFHPESQYPQLRLRIYSASRQFLFWLKSKTNAYGFKSTIRDMKRCSALVFGKQASLLLLDRVYHDNLHFALRRKQQIVDPFLRAWRNW